MNWSSPHLKCLLFSFDTAATHCDTTTNMGESSGWRHYTKPQHWKKERIQIHMIDHRMSYVAAVLSSTTLKFRVKHLRMLCQPQSPLFFLKIEAFLSRAAKIKNKEVQTGTGMEIRTKRGTSFCLRLHLWRGSAHYATLFKTYFVILYIFSFLMLYHSIFLAFLLSISLKYLAKCKLKWKY